MSMISLKVVLRRRHLHKKKQMYLQRRRNATEYERPDRLQITQAHSSQSDPGSQDRLDIEIPTTHLHHGDKKEPAASQDATVCLGPVNAMSCMVTGVKRHKIEQ